MPQKSRTSEQNKQWSLQEAKSPQAQERVMKMLTPEGEEKRKVGRPRKEIKEGKEKGKK